MPIPALIILICTLVAFIIIAAFILIKRGSIIVPEHASKDNMVTIEQEGYKVHVFFGDKVKTIRKLEVAKACYRATKVTNEAFGDGSNSNNKNIKKEIAVLFLSDDDEFAYGGYDNKEFTKNIMGFLGECKKNFARGIPMPVLRERLIEEVCEKGEPVIHELCHAVLGETNFLEARHEEKDVWAKWGKMTIQSKARELFLLD